MLKDTFHTFIHSRASRGQGKFCVKFKVKVEESTENMWKIETENLKVPGQHFHNHVTLLD